VVERVGIQSLVVTSAFRDAEGVIHRDLVDAKRTVLAEEHVTKVADVRDVG